MQGEHEPAVAGDDQFTVSPPDKVAGEAKRSRKTPRKRRTRRTHELRQLHAQARDRQRAWLATGPANCTARLTSELEAGYATLRADRANDKLPESWEEVNDGSEGTGLERLPYLGRPRRVSSV